MPGGNGGLQGDGGAVGAGVVGAAGDGDAAGAGVVAAAGSGGIGWPLRTMVTRLMRTGVSGLSSLLRWTRAIDATSRTEWASHWPKMVYLPLSSATASSVMKNCEPLVRSEEHTSELQSLR